MTESKYDDEVFGIEFRHEVVIRVAKDLIEGNKIISVPSWVGNDAHVINSIGEAQGIILRCAMEYFSNKPTGERRDELEAEMFKQICRLRIYDAIQEKVPAPAKLEHDIAELSKKIDDNNELLTRVMGILTEVLKRLDSKR